MADRLPVRLRAVECPVRHTLERLLADRKLASIRLAHRVTSASRLAERRSKFIVVAAHPSSLPTPCHPPIGMILRTKAIHPDRTMQSAFGPSML